MTYIILGYVVLYIFSVYWMQRDWRKDFDLDLDDLVIMLITSLTLTGVWLFMANMVSRLIKGNRIIAKRYRSR